MKMTGIILVGILAIATWCLVILNGGLVDRQITELSAKIDEISARTLEFKPTPQQPVLLDVADRILAGQNKEIKFVLSSDGLVYYIMVDVPKPPKKKGWFGK